MLKRKHIIALCIVGSIIISIPAGSPDFTFVAYGDPCHKPLHGSHIVPIILKQNPKFVICCGDIAGDPSSVADWNILLGQIDILKRVGIAYFPVVGNHDLSSDIGSSSVSAFRQVWDPVLTQQKAEYNVQMGSRTSLWYTMQYRNWFFIMKDNYHNSNSEHKAWLSSVFSQRFPEDQFTVVSAHYPTISAGYRTGGGNKGWDPSTHTNTYLPRGVDAVFQGDTHLFYRTVRDGITYINSSGGGRGLRTYSQSDLWPGDIYFSIHHITRFDVYGLGAVGTVIDTGENVLATFVMGDTASGSSIEVEKNNIAPSGTNLSVKPNPFNSKTAINFNIMEKRGSRITLDIYDAAGKKVKAIAECYLNYGPHYFIWDGTDRLNNTLPGALYIVKISIENKTLISKIIHLK
jgi:hypothetical protein